MRFHGYLVLLAVGLFSGSSSAGQTTVRSGAPIPTHISKPAYPAIAAARKVSGVILVDVAVRADGNVREASIVSGPKLLRNSAMKAALIWRFEPTSATVGDRSVRLTFIFHEPSYMHPAKEPDFTCPYQIEVEWLAEFNKSRETRR